MRLIKYSESVWSETLGCYVTSFEVVGQADKFSHCKKGGGGGSTTTVQKADPWQGQQSYLTDIFRRAQADSRTRNTFYPGKVVADLGQDTLNAQDSMRNYASYLQGNQGQLFDKQNQLLDSTNVYNNPAIEQVAQGAINPVVQALTEKALPAVRGGAQLAGQYGGSRQGVLESNAIRDATREMVDRTAKIYSDAYDSGLDAETKTLALAPSVAQTGLLPTSLMDSVGQQLRAYEQQLINARIAKHDFNQNELTNRLGAYQNLVNGAYGGSSTSSTSGAGAVSGGFGGALGGALMGASAAGMLGNSAAGSSMLAAIPGGGWALAGLGALAGFL